MRLSTLLVAFGLTVVGLAAPYNSNGASLVDRRQALSGLFNGVNNALAVAVSGLLDELGDALNKGDREKTLDTLQKLEPTKNPKNVAEALSITEKVAKSEPDNIVEYSARLIANGIISGSTDDLLSYAHGLGSAENGYDNQNPDPPKSVYPKAASCDARYTVSEDKLRSAIYIPDTFTYGEKLPVVLFPGTGATGWTSFRGSFIPLLTGVDWADPVWVNVPELLFGDAQVNAEYAAYALNYIASISKRSVAIIGWSQGNIDAQWAFKYWPSTCKVTTDHVAISADYKGTVLANFVDLSGITNTPSVVQQEAGSDFIKTLRSDGGDSGYVPTTSLYSSFLDEIVQPQEGTGASAYLLDERNVGVTNAEVQKVCAGKPGGSFYTHESMLINPLSFALAKDALTHDGPGEISRLDLGTVCASSLAPGLGLEDLLITENAIVIAGISVVTYLPKVKQEPAIKEYALKAAGTC
ncbi:lipase B [Fusarium subglutinans]|uniref:Lipase B n=1 Tax=Gibberella subglutinans TaxID=42677 RepID=A0A8H5Q6L8_GIBSU|nr:lipase B [Fusarium subglutinans]KAF5610121.1 lipase B [Fusarium subglutinans]